jgi:hypothetical protein
MSRDFRKGSHCGDREQAVSGWRLRRFCPQCGDLLDPKKRRDAVWCSESCRAVAYRRRLAAGEVQPRSTDIVSRQEPRPGRLMRA